MTIITKKVRLVPAPFVGTKFTIRLSADDLIWGIRNLGLAQGAEVLQIDWGDGMREESRGGEFVLHTYAQPGEYAVRLSDGINGLIVTGGDTDFTTAHAHKLIRFETTARNIDTLATNAFNGCVNLEGFNIAGSSLTNVNRLVFCRCTALNGRIDFPGVTIYPTTPTITPLFGCTGGITEIHFDTAMADTIGQSEGFKTDPTLGTGTATVFFDLNPNL